MCTDVGLSDHQVIYIVLEKSPELKEVRTNELDAIH